MFTTPTPLPYEPPALDARSLSVSYGRNRVLFDVSMEVPAGKVVALLGTNGAGKSTLLRSVAGLLRPDGGSVRLFGRDVTRRSAEQRVAQGTLLVGGGDVFPSLTVAENLRVSGYLLRRDPDCLAGALEASLAQFPALAGREQQIAGTLSGGERRMLALARAFLLSPRLLLIDELSSGLAPTVIRDLLAVVRELPSRGTTVLLVEQSVALAQEVAPTAYVLERGRVRYRGPTAELLTRDDLLGPVFLARAHGS